METSLEKGEENPELKSSELHLNLTMCRILLVRGSDKYILQDRSPTI